MERQAIVKPPYRVPSLSEIEAIPWNGFRVASLFAGAGGSCTGYRIAGFHVEYANEFVRAARQTYEANHSATLVDPRDIRRIQPEHILRRLKIALGDLDVLDGSPPCAAFSTAGRRHEYWDCIRPYSDRPQRTDDLFFEYARILRGVKPRVFVAENVSGLVKGVAKGYFKTILAELQAIGYRVEARLLDAQWLGVPQTRGRLFFIGVRDDIELHPAFPKPLPYRYSIHDALPWWSLRGRTFIERKAPPVEAEAWMTKYAVGEAWKKLAIGEQSDKYFELVRSNPARPAAAVTVRAGAAGSAAQAHPYECRKFSITELKRICSFPDDYVLTGNFYQQWERLGRAVPPLMMARIATTIRDEILCKSRQIGPSRIAA